MRKKANNLIAERLLLKGLDQTINHAKWSDLPILPQTCKTANLLPKPRKQKISWKIGAPTKPFT